MAEPRGRASQGINVGCLDLPVAITAQVVGPKRVNRNDDDVGPGLSCKDFCAVHNPDYEQEGGQSKRELGTT